MLASSKITQKNQTTLPRIVLEALGLKPSDRLVYEIENGIVTLRAKTERLVELKDRFSHYGKTRAAPISIADMHEAIEQSVAEEPRAYTPIRRKSRNKRP